MSDIKLCKVNATLKWKGAETLLLKEAEIPHISSNSDYMVQYLEIWKILQAYVIEMNAKRVLEFGTREGYSTRLFADALRKTGGHIWSVDINNHKMTAEELEGFDNITFLKADVMKLDWKIPVDILYIDDWHDPYHVYSELDRWAHIADTIMIHDVLQGYEDSTGIMKGIVHWCVSNYTPFSLYPLNGCGLIIIEKKRFESLYPNKEVITNDEFQKRKEANETGNHDASHSGNNVEDQKLGNYAAGL